eukprot:scaffold374_cov282-Alexandrium_tamarense.AAC.12
MGGDDDRSDDRSRRNHDNPKEEVKSCKRATPPAKQRHEMLCCVQESPPQVLAACPLKHDAISPSQQQMMHFFSQLNSPPSLPLETQAIRLHPDVMLQHCNRNVSSSPNNGNEFSCISITLRYISLSQPLPI